MSVIEVNYNDYKQAIVEILNLSLPQLKNKYKANISYIYSFIYDASLGYSSQNYIYLKKAATEANCSIDIIVNKTKRLINEIPQSNPKDYYKVLEVKQNSTNNEIRDNWIKLVKENHPDIKGDKGVEITKELNEAYNILNNKNTRSEYDASYFNYSPVKVKKSENSILENRKFLLAFSFCIVLLLGIFVNGYIDKPLNKQGNSELNARNNEGLTGYRELDSEKLKERYKEEVDSIYSKYSREDEFGNLLLSENEENNLQAKVTEEVEDNSISDKYDEDFNSESDFEYAGEENKELLTSKIDESDDQASLGSESDILNNDITTEKDKPLSNTDIVDGDKNQKENELIATRKTSQTNEPSRSSLYLFVADYVTAYKNRDFDKLIDLFSSNATENGISRKEFVTMYQNNFKKNEIIRYDIKVKNNEITNNLAHIDGDFTVVYKKVDSDDLKKKEGNISWDLEWTVNKWKIKELTYQFINNNQNI